MLALPQWYWPWATWYLHRARYASQPLRSDATRPSAAPARIPGWGWHRLAVMLGNS